MYTKSLNIVYSTRMCDPFLHLCMRQADREAGGVRRQLVRWGLALHRIDTLFHLVATSVFAAIHWFDKHHGSRKALSAPYQIFSVRQTLERIFEDAITKTRRVWRLDQELTIKYARLMFSSEKEEAVLRGYWCWREAREAIRKKEIKNFFVSIPPYKSRITSSMTRAEKISCLLSLFDPNDREKRRVLEILLERKREHNSERGAFPPVLV